MWKHYTFLLYNLRHKYWCEDKNLPNNTYENIVQIKTVSIFHFKLLLTFYIWHQTLNHKVHWDTLKLLELLFSATSNNILALWDMVVQSVMSMADIVSSLIHIYFPFFSLIVLFHINRTYYQWAVSWLVICPIKMFTFPKYLQAMVDKGFQFG